MPMWGKVLPNRVKRQYFLFFVIFCHTQSDSHIWEAHNYSWLTKVTGQHMTVMHRVLWWFKCFLNYQLNPCPLLWLWPSIKLLESSMTHQQKIGSSVRWKPWESFANLLPNMESNHQPHPISGPSTKTQAQPKIVCILGIQRSLQAMQNYWWYGTVSRIVGNPFNRLHKIPTLISVSALFVIQLQMQDTTDV